MENYTSEEASELIQEGTSDCSIDDLDTDVDGQVIVTTGIYRWKDGSYHNEAET